MWILKRNDEFLLLKETIKLWNHKLWNHNVSLSLPKLYLYSGGPSLLDYGTFYNNIR